MRELARLTTAQLCGQLLVVGYPGPEIPGRLEDQLALGERAGVVLFRRNVPTPEVAWNACQQAAVAVLDDLPPFVGIDQEGGRVRRLTKGVLQLPAMRAFGHHDDPALSLTVAQAVASELVALGFNINFAPVADVDSNSDNPVIGDRSFGPSPALVTRHATAFAKGFQSQGLMSCVKHFPGHGDTHEDSHIDLPTVDKTTTELRQVELYPFERLARKVTAVMTSHVLFPAIDSVPATHSARFLQTLLRKEFDFDGVIFSDDLLMGAMQKHQSIEASAIKAVQAGCDVLLICDNAVAQERAHAALIERAETDSRFRRMCLTAVERSVTLRRRFPAKPRSTFEAARAVLQSAPSKSARRALKKLR